MRVTCIQLEMKDQSKGENRDDLFEMLEQAPKSDLIILPEIWPIGFFRFDRYRNESETIDGPTVCLLREKAREKGCYLHMGSFVEKDENGCYNTSLMFNPKGEIIANYKKIHLFGYQSKEQQLLTPGKTVVTTETDFGVIGLSTCYDLRFPELFRKMVDKGATIFLVTSAWPKVRLEAWKLFCQTRALENLSFLISCNCSGFNEEKQYAGHSMIVSPQGEILSGAGEGGMVLSSEIDPEESISFRKDFPALNDRVFR